MAGAGTIPADPLAAPAAVGSRPVRRGGFALAVAVGLSSALSFGFHAAASRILLPADYSGLAALLALMVACAVPIGAAQAAVTRGVAQVDAAGGAPSGRHALIRALAASAIIAGVGVAAAPAVAGALRLPSVVPAALMALWLAVTAPEAVVKALLVGSHRLRPVAVALVLGATVRIAALAVLVPWAGLTAAMAATIAAEVACTSALAVVAHRRGLLRRQACQARVVWPDAGRALSVQLALWLFAALAVVIGRRALDPSTVGAFAAMATAAGSCIFLPQAVATAAFPRFVADGSSRLLLRATALALAVGVVCAAVLCVDPELLFRLLFGPNYRPDRAVLALLCAHFVALGCLTVVAQYLVARRHAGAWCMWAALAASAGVAVAVGREPLLLAGALALPSTALTAGFVARALATYRAARVRGPVPVGPGDAPPAGAAAGRETVPAPARQPAASCGRGPLVGGAIAVAAPLRARLVAEAPAGALAGARATPVLARARPAAPSTFPASPRPGKGGDAPGGAGTVTVPSGPSGCTVIALAPMTATSRPSAAVPPSGAGAGTGEALAGPAACDLTVVVPSYNGGRQLRPCIEGLTDALDRTGMDYEIVVSVDGSTDGSDRTVEGVHPRVVVERAPINEGKGAALRRGFLRARGEIVGFIDGDGDIDPSVLVALHRHLVGSRAWLAVASKNVPGATVAASPRRKVMSAGYRLFVHWLFDLDVSDTQCGCKLFRRRYLASVLGHTQETGFALDLELLALGARMGMADAVEAPVVLRRGELGTISSRSVLRMVRDTVGVYRRLPRRSWADQPRLTAPSPIGAEQFSSPLLP